MQYKYHFLWVLFLLFMQTEVWSEPLKIGVLAKRGSDVAHQKWDATADYLSQNLKDHEFIIKPLSFDEVQAAVTQQKIDFLLANPSVYIEMEVQYGISRIATLKNIGPGGAFTHFGGVIFARADRNDISTIKDLKKGHSFMAVSEKSLGGFQLAWNELKNAGIDPYNDFSELLFRSKHDSVVYAVLNGQVDVGTVRTDTLERMAAGGLINIDDFKIIGEKRTHENSTFPYHYSTILTPEWPFAKLAHVSDGLAQIVAIELMKIPVDSEAAINGKNEGWTVPQNYQPIRNLLMNLKIGPFREYGQLTINKIIRKYWPTILLSAIVFLALMTLLYYILKTNRKLHHSRERLAQEVDERLIIEERLSHSHTILSEKNKQNSLTLERLQRVEKSYELNSVLVTSSNSQELLQKALNQLIELTDGLLGAIYLLDENTALLEVTALHGMSESAFDLSNSLPAQALTERKIKHYKESSGDVMLRTETGIGEIACREILIMPLYINQLSLGVITLGSFSGFPDDDLPLLGHMANQISILLNNVLIKEKLDHNHRQLKLEKQAKDKLLDKLKYMANHDELTHLPNRRLFYELYLKTLQHAHREGVKTAILYMDLNAFKQINDTFGHAIGDRVLVDFVQIVQSMIRQNDLFARIGGDEFILVLSNIYSRDNIETILTNIEKKIIQIEAYIGQDIPFGVSTGVLICGPNQLDPETLIKQSDKLMYKAKFSKDASYFIHDISRPMEINAAVKGRVEK